MTAVFWDFHGTLIKPKSIWSTLVDQELRRCGHPIPLEVIQPHVSTGFTWDRPEITYEDKTGSLWWDDMLGHVDELFCRYKIPAQIRQALRERIHKRVLDPGTYILFEDAVAALKGCVEAGAANYLLSNNFPELEEVVRAMGLSPYFSGYIVSARLGYEKPHPRIFEVALALAGNPGTAFMVGDNPNADVAGGRAAGMRTVYVHNPAPCQADHICAALAEIPAIVAAARSENHATV